MQRQRRPRYDLSLCPVPLRSAARARLPLTFLAGALLAVAAHAGLAMTLDERIACREKIEDVYWAHRLWPNENQGQKPAREAVAPHAAIAARVEESLRYETAIGELWEEALSPQVIQAEMDREARASRDPAMLRELWAALDDDPSRVAECLVRPELAERRIKDRYANDPSLHGATRQRAVLEIEASATFDDLRAGSGQLLEVDWRRAGAGEVRIPQPGVVYLAPEEWRRALGMLRAALGPARAEARGRPGTRSGWPAGSELSGLPLHTLSALREDPERFFVKSVLRVSPGSVRVATVSWAKVPFEEWWSTRRQTTFPASPPAASYVLPTVIAGGCLYDSWTTSRGLSSTTPRARDFHTAVWTGSEMIVWGGFDLLAATSFNTGGRYTPATDAWVATSTVGAPSDRHLHTAVWTGSQMIVWGGFGSFGFLDTGGRYSPASDTWLPTSTVSAPAVRDSHTAVWTGSAMIVWGGETGSGGAATTNTGGRYDPVSDSWVATTTTGAPGPRLDHTAVWTGTEMIVWGGSSAPLSLYGDGGRYNPSTDTWTAPSGSSAPSPRVGHSAVWTGTQMLVWGGYDNYNDVNTGGRYTPATDSWTATSTVSAPAAGQGRTVVWTGAEMIVWGGYGSQGDLNSGGRYSPASDHWVATSAAGAPTPRAEHSAVWTGTEMIVWGGSGPSSLTNSGGRYTPATDGWVATGIQGALSERAHHTSVWTGSEMIVWGGADGLGSFASGGRYAPATDSWVPTSMTNAPAARSLHTAIWTGTEMVVWGGSNGSGDLDTGGRYMPATDAWLATDPGAPAPVAREQHTAVWTGTEMIVWGGSSFGLALQSGGRYDPSTDLWTATAITTFPSARYGHTAVWTGSEMIVWGGWDGTNYDNAGGRYAPATNSWARMASVPTGRLGHTAVWTGHEMIVWGGINAQTLFNSGDRYTPDSDGWQPTNLNGAPDGRLGHSAVWTGSEMVVWGGAATRPLNTGGRYLPSADRWVATDVLEAPEGRAWHSAVWSGSAMLVWGGVSSNYLDLSSGYLNDGARYCPLPSPSSFFTVAPCRLFDSRTGPWLVSGVERTIAVAGSCGIPAGASAAALNLTAVGPSEDGSLCAYPTAGQPTGLGIVDFRARQTRANNTIVLLSSSGALTLQALVGQSGLTDAVVDVVGFFQ
jgi:N-acetylneuraminic acid mutarotase